VIGNCIFHGTDRGLRIKARRGRGGVVEDVRASNLVMDGVLCPIVVNLFYGCGAWGEARVTDTRAYPVDETTPRFRRISFSHITARRAKYAAAYVLGLPEMYVDDLSLSDVSVHMDESNTEAGQPAMSPVCTEHCRAGVIARHTRRLTLRDVRVFGQIGAEASVTDSE
jgi:polygalacturonase